MYRSFTILTKAKKGGMAMAGLCHVYCEDCRGCCPVLPMSIEQLDAIKKQRPEIVEEFLAFKINFVFCRQTKDLVMFQEHDSEITIAESNKEGKN